MTTDRTPTRRRWSKDAVRTVAWVSGALAFVASVAAVAQEPKPAAAAGRDPSGSVATTRPGVERVVIRRIVVIRPAAPSAPVAVAPPSTGTVAAPAPAPDRPATSTGAS
jgi:hypothetical protein